MSRRQCRTADGSTIRYGYDKLSGREIHAVVNRLYDPNWQSRHDKTKERERRERKERIRERPLSSTKQIDELTERLCRGAANKAPDRNRTGACKQQGICNTFAWKGWN
eukprot:gene9731-10725_t